MKYRDLTPNELDALKAFADKFGKAWKTKLAFEYWPNARIFTDSKGNDRYELHTLRNHLGPVWLSKFTLEA